MIKPFQSIVIGAFAGFGFFAAMSASAQAVTYGADLAEKAGLTRDMVNQSSSTIQSGINRLSGGSLTSGRLASFSAGNTGFAASAARQRLGIWSTGSFSRIENDRPALRTDGNFSTFAAGLDYLVVDGVVIGVSGAFERGDFRTRYNNGNLDTRGLTVSPYFAVNVLRYVTLSGQFGYTTLSKDTDRVGGTIRADYNARRLFGLGRLALNYPSGNWRFGADLSYLAANEDNDAYTESNGARVAGFDTTVNQARLGLRVGYAFRPEHLGTVTPYLMARLEHDFEDNDLVIPVFNADGTAAGGTATISGENTGVVLGGGMDFDFGNFLGAFEANTLLGKQDVTNHTFMGNVKYRF